MFIVGPQTNDLGLFCIFVLDYIWLFEPLLNFKACCYQKPFLSHLGARYMGRQAFTQPEYKRKIRLALSRALGLARLVNKICKSPAWVGLN